MAITRVAFIGLGNMGYPMAGHLAAAGYQVCVYNRTAGKAKRWVDEFGGSRAATPLQAAQGAEVVFVCVGNDDDVRSVVLGEAGVLAGMQEGGYLVDHTTASAELARELSRLGAERGVAVLDAPVSGGQAGAEKGCLTIMVGGEQEHYAAVRPVLECYARMQRLMGPAGSGQLTKMVNQICVGGLLQGLSEALHFAEKSGVDAQAAMEVISGGAAQSWQQQNRYESMLAREFDFGFAVKWMRKDYALVLDEARRNGAQLPVTALVDQFYADVIAMGGENWDTSSLIKRLDRN